MLLAESLLMLALDPLSGRLKREWAGSQTVLTAALLLELAALRELVLQDGKLQLQHALPSYHLLVEEVHQRLRQRPPTSPEDTLRRRATAPSGLLQLLLQGLADRDLLHRDGRRRYRLFGPRDYPIRSMQAQHDARALIERGLSSDVHELKPIAALVLLRRSGLAGELLQLPVAEAIGKRLAQLHKSLHANDSPIPEHDRLALRTIWAIGEALEAARG
jgi:hypothetical protein